VHRGGGEVVGAAVPDLAVDFEDERRLAELLARAIADCIGTPAGIPTERIPLLVGLSEMGRPGGCSRPEAILGAVEGRLGTRFHPKWSRVISQGHVAGFAALQAARGLLREAGASACLIAAADSYLNARSLRWLERDRRLKAPDNPDGVIPGEAAAAVLVRARPSESAEAAVSVTGIGLAHEEATVLTDQPLLGIGLARAARGALEDAGLAIHEIDFRLSDVTGESYGFKEQALALVRLLRVRKEEFPLWHCADTIGDTGAAAGLCHLVVAAAAFRKGYAPGRRALCFASSVPGERGAAVVERDGR
jgi:3-oxoacyl-[acyl-carrier-protein] synthase-1